MYQVLIKINLKIIRSSIPFFKKIFWPVAVDRTVDRLCFRSERSTGRSIALLTVWVRACVHVSRSTGWSTGPHIGRPTFGRLKAPMFLFVSVDRAVDRGLATAKFFENPVDRPVDRVLDFSPNGYLIKHVFKREFYL